MLKATSTRSPKKRVSESRATKPVTARSRSRTTGAANKVKSTEAPVAPLTFSKGQKWQMLLGQAEIVHVGKFLIDYRLHTIPLQKRTPIRTDLLTDFTRTIKKNKARLVAP